jgi:hypothetical protein
VTNDSESLFQEVEESVRQDRFMAMAKRYGPWLLGAFIAMLIGIGGWQVYQGMQENAAREQADAFSHAQEQARGGEAEAAKLAFEALSTEGPQTYRVMAMMERAGVLEGEGDLQASLAAFDAAAEAARDPLMKQTAQLRAAYIVADTQDFQALQTRLQPLIDADGQISFLARELLAVEAWEAGHADLARDTLNTLTLAFDAPESVRQRAQLALSVLGPAAEPAAPAPAAAAPAPTPGETK